MKPIIYLALILTMIFYSINAFAMDDPSQPITVESTKGAKLNYYCYESASDNIKENPILLVHGFNSSGEIWTSKNENYVKELTGQGYDVIVVDMRGNPVDTDGDHKIDAPIVGNSWGYAVRDLGDDVGVALKEGMDYLNKNLPGRAYKKADVITHSTGALAVTAYSRSIGLVPYRNNIATVIELAPPNNGSTSLVANIKNMLGIIPSVFAQSVTAYQYALEVADNKIWIPGSRMESENLRKELSPDSMFLKSIQGLGPDTRIRTFIAVGNQDWVVGDWSPVIEKRDDIGYEYFLGMDHFNFCNSDTVIKAILDKLAKGEQSIFFKRFKPYKAKQLSFLSGPGIDHPDDTFDTISFATGINISPRRLFDLYLRVAARKNKAYLLKYWEVLSLFEDAQLEISTGNNMDEVIDKWEEALAEKNKLLRDYYMYASREYLETPDIAVLANGYYNEMRKLIIEKVGEPVRVIDQAFESYVLDEQKILVIPTGGLSGLSHSTIFKNKISEYAQNGGTIICFTQQYGYDFNALPGGRLSGYGWQEDASCHSKAAYIQNFHQVLSSQTELYPDIKLDGYFTDYPEGANILLRRSKNQMPAMLLYNFGKGTVIVASMYSDWGSLNGQASAPEINLVRDVLRWAKSASDLPEYKAGESFENPVQINKGFGYAEMILKSPEGEVLQKDRVSEAIYRLDKTPARPGIYSVDYMLYDSDSKMIQPQSEGFYFSYSQPPPAVPQAPDFAFDITSDNENYITGNTATFNFHIRNNTAKGETIRYKAVLQHHKMEFNDVITVPANQGVSFEKKIIAASTDLLRSDFYSSQNIFIGRAERGISVFEPLLEINMSADKLQYQPGESASIDIGLVNKKDIALDAIVMLDVIDSNDRQIFYSSSDISLVDLGSASWSQSFLIPEDVSQGELKARVSAFLNSKLIGYKCICLEVPKPFIDDGGQIETVTQSYIMPGAEMDFSVNMENIFFKGQPISGSVSMNNKGERMEDCSLEINVVPDMETGELQGVIKDDKGIALKGASINGVYSNKDGRYKLRNLAKGQALISMKAPGFDSVSKTVEIFPGDNNMDINLKPSKYGNLSGIVENSIGSIVTLEPVNVSGSGASARFSVTSGEGLFKFGYLAIGEYLLTVSPGDISKNIEINEGENFSNDSVSQSIYEDLGETEPNNGFSTASGINLNSRIHAKISSAGDEDFYKFNIQEKGILYIKMYEVPQGLRPSIKIYDPSIPGRVVSMKGGAANEKIILETEFDKPGTYYLLVRDWYGNISSQDAYSLNFNFIKTLDEYEPNETKEDAVPVDFGKNYFATIAVKGDSDFYKLSVPDAGRINVYLKEMPVNVRPYMKLYRDTGQSIDIKGGIAGEDVAMEFDVTNPSNYYLQVYDRYNSESSFLRYRVLATYVPLDAYPAGDFACFKKTGEIQELKDEKKLDFDIPAIAEKGKYYIDVALKSSTSQLITRIAKSFYVTERLEVAVEAGIEADIFRIKVKNLSSVSGVRLFAEARCGDFAKREDFILNGEKVLEFNIPGLGKNEKVYYGIYFESGKALYLNSCLTSGGPDPEPPSIKIIKAGCGKDVYEHGDSVALIWKIDTAEARAVKLKAELINPDSSSAGLIEDEFYLAQGLNDINKEVAFDLKQHGIYRIAYDFEGVGQGSIFFDVGQKETHQENHEPVLFTIGGKDVIAGGTLEFFVEAADIDGDLLIYSAQNLPGGSNFDPLTKRFSWQPGEMQVGEHFVTFIVTDGKARSSEKVKITVSSQLPLLPEAEPIAQPASGMAPLEVHFNCRSINQYKKIVKYEWDFDGKGVYDWSSLESGEVIFTYTGDGSFPATLRVTDKSGAVNTAAISVNVGKNPDAPGVYVNASPVKGIAPCKVFFKGDAFCPKGVSKHEWDFDGDGVFDACSSESGEVVKAYGLPGKYKAEFRVTSIEGLSSSENISIEIEGLGALNVSSSISPAIGSAPLEVDFETVVNAAAGIQKYQWDFDGDGMFDYTSLVSGAVKHSYREPGVYAPAVRITDSNNVSSQDKKEVKFGIIDPENTKKGRISLDQKNGKAPITVKFSFKTESPTSNAEYLWDFDNNGATDLVTEEPVAEFTYNDSGAYVVRLDVKMDHKIIISCQDTIYITNGLASKPALEICSNAGLEVKKNKSKKASLSDATYIAIPAGILELDDTVNIEKIGPNQIQREINLDQAKSAGEYREYKFKNRKEPFDKEILLSIPYVDLDQDGFIDATNVNELTLDAYWYDDNAGEWKILADCLIFPKENMVTVKTSHCSIFGLAGIEKEKDNASQPGDSGPNDDSGSGGSCFIATAAFGSPMAGDVMALKAFRDNYLLKTETGKCLVKFYYRFSPPIAEFIKHKPLIKAFMRYCLKLLVLLLQSIL